MFAYGFFQLGSSVISAISLFAIALSFCSIKKEVNLFNECVEEIKANCQTSASAIRFCNGG
tara:strand:+ start:222 stop:404 length:183 start_codon:yes stop_codon:yes gene_type:complete